MFIREELYYSKTIVIHCRDKRNSMDAYKTCLKVFEEEIPAFHREVTSIHFHSFNRGLSTLGDWLARFPRIRIGVTSLLLRKGWDPEFEAVVEHLDLEQILLETDSPYLTPPVHGSCAYNTPYGLEEVARRVAQLKDTTIKAVPTTTGKNAADLYGLKV